MLLYEGERNMRFVRQDQLLSPEGEARGGHELVLPDKSHVTLSLIFILIMYIHTKKQR